MRKRWALSGGAAVAVLAAIAAGCGNGSAGSTTISTGTSTSNSTAGQSGTATLRGKAVKFAECMRANGVSAFPDPNASGELTIDAVANGSSVDTSSAVFTRALDACKDLEPAGFTGHRRSAQQQEFALEFARCMRDNGVEDFPDPGPDDPMIDTNRIPSANQPGGMSILDAATGKCQKFLAGAGVTGGR